MTVKTKKNGNSKIWVEYYGFDDLVDAQVAELVGLKLVASSFSAELVMRELEFEGSEKKIEEAEALLASVQASNDNLPRFIVSTEG